MQIPSSKTITKLISIFVGLASAVAVQAATVTFTLNIDVGNSSFTLFVSSSMDDNDGIVAYNVPLNGTILTLEHNSPNGISGAGSGDPGKSVGFEYLRSADGASTLFASQDTITPTNFPVYGFGQLAGNLNSVSSDFSSVEQQVYEAPLLLASGTFGATAPSFNLAGSGVGANTFDDKNGNLPLELSAATINTVTQRIPEPSSTALLGLGGLALMLRRRR